MMETVAIGTALQSERYRLTRESLVRYAGASGDFNPIHWNERTAVAVGLPNVIAHGMLTMAQAMRLVTDWVGDPGAVRECHVRFVRPVPIPDDDSGIELEVSGTVSDVAAGRVTIAVQVLHDGNPVLGDARVVLSGFATT